MCKREFVPVTPDDPAACSEFRRLMVPYSRELDEHGLPPLSPEMLNEVRASGLIVEPRDAPEYYDYIYDVFWRWLNSLLFTYEEPSFSQQHIRNDNTDCS